MPSFSVTVSLSEVLDVCSRPLSDIEIWAILSHGAETLQDLFITEQATGEYGPAFVINPDTLNLTSKGNVEFARAQTVRQYVNYMAPEMEDGFVMTPTAVEKIYVYALGKSLVYSVEYSLKADQHVRPTGSNIVQGKPLNISRPLESLLRSMTEQNSSDRMALVKVLEACSLQYDRQYRGKVSHHHTILNLYRSIMGVEGKEENVSDITFSNNDASRNIEIAPERTAERSRRSRKRSHNSDRSKRKQKEQQYRSRSRSHSSSYSRSRSHSKRRGKGRGADSPDSGYHRNTPLLSPPLPFEEYQENIPSASRPHNRRSDHLSDITFSASQNRQQPQGTSNHLKPPRHKASHRNQPVNGHSRHPDTAGRGEDGGNPAFRKYVKLKDRQRKLRALRLGRIDDDASDELSDIVMDHMSETKSMMSLASYSQGAYHPDMHKKYGSNMALKIGGRDSDRDSIISSEASLFNDHNAMRATAGVSDPYIQLLQKLSAAPLPPPPTIPPPANHPQHHHHQPHQRQAPVPPQPAQKPKPFYGPEFVHNATKPIHRIHVPLQGESRKNPNRACRVVIVLLNGQKLECMCDPSTTEQQLFEALITDIELPEFYFFGLTYIIDGEHFFLESDTKLHKVSPDGWRDSWKSQHTPVTFTLHLRVKFYMDNLAALKHQTTRHLLYLQLRRDILEERCQIDEDQAVALAGVALQAEYGNYNKETMGRNYFIPEHYFSGKAVRKLGTGYVRDHALEVHREATSLAELEAEAEFIKLVHDQIPEYGIHFHKLMKKKNEMSNVAWVGINMNRLVLAENSAGKRIIIHQLPWAEIQKISFNKRRFSVQPRPELGQIKPVKMNFYTNTYRKGQYLLKFCTAQHSFQLKMKTRLSAPSGHPEMGGEEATSIGDTEDIQDMEEEDVGTESNSGQEVEVLTLAANGATRDVFSAKDIVPQRQPMNYRNPPPYRPDSSASMINLPTPDDLTFTSRLGHVGGSVMRAATTGALNQAGVESASEDTDEQPFVASHAYVIDMSTRSMDQTVLSPPANETISNTLHQRFTDELLSPEPKCERELFEVVLRKEPRHGMGITIVGGENNTKMDLGVYIKTVTPGGSAARDGRIKVGDKILAINDIQLDGMKHHSAVQIIKNSPPDVKLLISQVQAPGSIRKRDYDDALILSKLQASFTTHSGSDVELSVSPRLGDSSTMPVITVKKCASVNSKADEDGDVRKVVHNSSSIPGNTGLLEDQEKLNSTTADVHSTLSQVDSLYSEMAASELPADDQDDDESSSSDSDFDDVVQGVIDGQQLTPATGVKGQTGDSQGHTSARSYSDRSEVETFDVTLKKRDGSFGLNVTGGVNTSVRYGGIYVKYIVPDSVADIDGQIQKGDRLLEVDGVSLDGYTHKEGVQTLRLAPNICTLLVERGTVSLSRKSSDSSYESPVTTTTSQMENLVIPERGNIVESAAPPTHSAPSQDTSMLTESSAPSVDVFEISQDTSVTQRDTTLSVSTLSEGIEVLEMSQETIDNGLLEMSIETVDNGLQVDLATVHQLYANLVTADNTYTVELEKGSRGLGFSVTGGLGPEVTDSAHCVVRVKHVFPIGRAADNGRIQKGDVILQVNEDRIQGLTHLETMELLRKVGGRVSLLMCRPDDSVLPPLVLDSNEEALIQQAAQHVSKSSTSSNDTPSESEPEEEEEDKEKAAREDALITPPTNFAPEHYPTDLEGYILPKVVSPPPPLPISPPPVLIRTRSLSPDREREVDNQTDISYDGEEIEVEVGVASLMDSCRSEEIVLIHANKWKNDSDINSETVTDQSYIDSRETTPFSGGSTPVVEISPGDSGEMGGVQLQQEGDSSSSSVSDGSHSSPASVIDKSQTLDSLHLVRTGNTNNVSASETESESESEESSYDVVKYDTGQSTSLTHDTGGLVPDFQLDGDLQSLPEGCEQDTSLNGDRSDADDSEILEDDLRRLEEKYNLQEEAENQSDDSASEEDKSDSDTSLSDQEEEKEEDEEGNDEEEKEQLKTGENEVTLRKPEGKGLGFTVAGGANTGRGCYIKAVLQNPALSDGTLKPGDALIKVNGIDMRSLSHFEAVTVLREASELVTIRVYREPTPGQVEEPKTVSSSTDSGHIVPSLHSNVQEAEAQKLSESQTEPADDNNVEQTVETEDDENRSESDRSTESSSSGDNREPAEYSDQLESDTETADRVPENPDLTVSREEEETDSEDSEDQDEESAQPKEEEEERLDLKSTFTLSMAEVEEQSRPKSPETNVYHIDLEKPATGSMGIGLVTAESENQTGVFVRTISDGGVARADGRLSVGDKLLQINGQSLVGLNHNKAANLLRTSEGSVVLTVSRSKSRTFAWLEEDKRQEAELHQSTARQRKVNKLDEDASYHDNTGDDGETIDDMVAAAKKVLQAVEEDADDAEFLRSLTQENIGADRKSHQYLSAAEVIDLMPDQIHVEEGQDTRHHSDHLSDLDGTGKSWNISIHDEANSSSSESEHSEKDLSFVDSRLTYWCDSVRKLDALVPEEVTSDWLDSLPMATIADSIQSSIPSIIEALNHKIGTDVPLEEFKVLRNVKVTDSSTAANKTHNRSKNRFRNVLPYDETRVILSKNADSDYINASHISMEVGGSTCSYIACQGPLPNTTDDFWRMVWQSDVTVIAMLTLDMEAKKVKCHRYWPDSIETPVEVCEGRLRLTLLYLNTLDDFDIRNILMEDTITGESRCVYHINYTSWPDHGVPNSAVPLLQCMRLCHLLRGSAPVVVHCSAGIGRTGTFITIDLALILIENGLKFNLPEIVTNLRRQRHGMIQTRDQYTFCYTACVEVLQSVST